MEFEKYLTYCRQLQFNEKPDYAFLKKLFKDLFSQQGYDYDYVYDWTIHKAVFHKPAPESVSMTQQQAPGQFEGMFHK